MLDWLYVDGDLRLKVEQCVIQYKMWWSVTCLHFFFSVWPVQDSHGEHWTSGFSAVSIWSALHCFGQGEVLAYGASCLCIYRFWSSVLFILSCVAKIDTLLTLKLQLNFSYLRYYYSLLIFTFLFHFFFFRYRRQNLEIALWKCYVIAMIYKEDWVSVLPTRPLPFKFTGSRESLNCYNHCVVKWLEVAMTNYRMDMTVEEFVSMDSRDCSSICYSCFSDVLIIYMDSCAKTVLPL